MHCVPVQTLPAADALVVSDYVAACLDDCLISTTFPTLG